MNPEDPYGHISAEESFTQFNCLATLQESHPIRTVAFSPTGSVFSVGTNSKALRLCQFNGEEQAIEVLHERAKHHDGSVYCASWSSDSRLIATGSNDKMVKVIKVFLDDAENGGYGMVSNRWGAKGNEATSWEGAFWADQCTRTFSNNQPSIQPLHIAASRETTSSSKGTAGRSGTSPSITRTAAGYSASAAMTTSAWSGTLSGSAARRSIQ